MEVNNLFPNTLLEFTLENANFTGCLGTDDKCHFLNDTINNEQIKHCNQKLQAIYLCEYYEVKTLDMLCF